MPGRITTRFDTSDFRAGITRFRQKAPKAIARALNRSIRSGQTQAVRDVSKDVGLNQAAVRDRVTLSDATPSALVARLGFSLARIALIHFGATGPRPSRGKGRGVSYRIGGRRGRLPHAFIATMRSGHRGVFARTRQARLPVRELRGPSVGHVFEKHLPAAKARAGEQLTKNLAHELKFALTESAR
jgi:hypothetical protein